MSQEQKSEPTTTFTVASSGEDLRLAARTGDEQEAQEILARYTGNTNELSKFLPAVLGSSDRLSGNKALHYCCANGHLPILTLLLQHNVDINATNHSGSTALHYASLNGHLEIVQELLRNNAKPVVQNKFGKTALDEARSGRKDSIAEFLLRHVEQVATMPHMQTEEEEQEEAE